MEHSTTNVDEILKQRGSVYGSYGAGVSCRAMILEALNNKHRECNGIDLPEELRIMFSDIALKLMRIASDPLHQDSYIDLAGYAKIIKEYKVPDIGTPVDGNVPNEIVLIDDANTIIEKYRVKDVID